MSAYYGRAADYSYFQGCSDGGREAMMESQRYRAISTASSQVLLRCHCRGDGAFHLGSPLGADDRGALLFDAAAATLLHDAVIEDCDALDGLKDGQIDDPRLCHSNRARDLFKNAFTAELPDGGASGCRREILRGPVDERGRHLFYGGEPYGSELSWVERFALPVAVEIMFEDAVKNMIFQQSLGEQATVESWRFDGATFERTRQTRRPV